MGEDLHNHTYFITKEPGAELTPHAPPPCFHSLESLRSFDPLGFLIPVFIHYCSRWHVCLTCDESFECGSNAMQKHLFVRFRRHVRDIRLCCPRPFTLLSSFILLPSLPSPWDNVFDVIENVYPYPSPPLSPIPFPPPLPPPHPVSPTAPSLFFSHPFPPPPSPPSSSPAPPPLSPQDPPVRSSVFSGYLSALQRLIM